MKKPYEAHQLYATYHPNAKTTFGSFISCKSPPWSNILGSGSGSGLKQEQISIIKVFSGSSFQNEAGGELPFAVETIWACSAHLGTKGTNLTTQFFVSVSNWTLHRQQNSLIANWEGIPWSSTSSSGSFSALISSTMMTIFSLLVYLKEWLRCKQWPCYNLSCSMVCVKLLLKRYFQFYLEKSHICGGS